MINIGIVWVYGTGNAVTLGLESYSSFNTSLVDDIYNFSLNNILEIQIFVVDHIEGRNNYRMPNYHRLDISINMKKRKMGRKNMEFWSL